MLKYLSYLLIFATLVSCDNRQLVISDKLDLEQKKAWRTALEFPKYCKNGFYEWLDETSPIMYFIQAKQGPALVYNVCERYAYQDLINVFSLEGDKQKPRLIIFPVIELDESTVQYTDEKGNALKSPKGEFKVKISNLVLQRGIEILPNGNINVIRHSTGTGTCGTLTTYEIKNSKAKAVEFHAQINCDNKQMDMKKWPTYKIDCPNIEQGPLCRVQIIRE